MFAITNFQYNQLISKALFISKTNASDIVHDAILKYDSFDECIMKMKFEKTKYNTVKEIDLTRAFETKICIKCNIPSPISCFEVYRYKSILSTKNVCIECRFKHRKKYDELNKERINERTRLRWATDNNFSEKRINEHVKWAKENKDHVNNYQNEWREKNREKSVEYMKKWRLKNKEDLKIKRRKYFIENREQIKKKEKEYRVRNREALLEKRRIYEKTRRSKNSL